MPHQQVFLVVVLFHSHDELAWRKRDPFYPVPPQDKFLSILYGFRWHLDAFKQLKMAVGVCMPSGSVRMRQTNTYTLKSVFSSSARYARRVAANISNCMLFAVRFSYRCFWSEMRSLRVYALARLLQMDVLCARGYRCHRCNYKTTNMGTTYKSQQCQCHERDRAFSFLLFLPTFFRFVSFTRISFFHIRQMIYARA